MLTVVMPVYNREDLIRYALESSRRASQGLSVETIVVDDGSTTPVAESIQNLGFSVTKVIRQTNQGLLYARLTGLAAATGRYLVFLDSDDLVSPAKFRLQTEAMQAAEADVSYTDQARCVLAGDYDTLEMRPELMLRTTSEAADFFLAVQPAPHNPVFLTSYLRDIVDRAYFPPSPDYNPVAEIWFYHNAAPRPGRVVHVPGPHTIIGSHPGERLTNNWERLGVASLAVMEAFARSVPDERATARAREIAAEVAFSSWRRLPIGFSHEFANRELALWRLMRRRGSEARGGPLFRIVSRCIGPVAAGRLFRRVQGKRYSSCRTMSDEDVSRLIDRIPPPSWPVAASR